MSRSDNDGCNRPTKRSRWGAEPTNGNHRQPQNMNSSHPPFRPGDVLRGIIGRSGLVDFGIFLDLHTKSGETPLDNYGRAYRGLLHKSRANYVPERREGDLIWVEVVGMGEGRISLAECLNQSEGGGDTVGSSGFRDMGDGRIGGGGGEAMFYGGRGGGRGGGDRGGDVDFRSDGFNDRRKWLEWRGLEREKKRKVVVEGVWGRSPSPPVDKAKRLKEKEKEKQKEKEQRELKLQLALLDSRNDMLQDDEMASTMRVNSLI